MKPPTLLKSGQLVCEAREVIRATQFYGGAAIYCVTPTDEKTARAVAALGAPAPVQRWELPAAPVDPDRDRYGDDDPEPPDGEED